MRLKSVLGFNALRSPPARVILLNSQPQSHLTQAFTSSALCSKKSNQLPPRPSLPDSEIKHVYLKGSGPGGQKINKTSSAVQLTHIPTGLVVKSQATRSQSQNHTIARRILAEKIEFLEKGDQSRVAKKIERVQKKKRSREKKSRRKYRKLEEGEEGSRNVDGGVARDGRLGAPVAASAIVLGNGVECGRLSGMNEEDIEYEEEWDDNEDGMEDDAGLEEGQETFIVTQDVQGPARSSDQASTLGENNNTTKWERKP